MDGISINYRVCFILFLQNEVTRDDYPEQLDGEWFKQTLRLGHRDMVVNGLDEKKCASVPPKKR